MGITIVHDMNKTHNILIVDDEETLLEVTVEILQDVTENIEFIKALNGLEAKKIIEEKKIDMVVTDMQMPKMSGEDLIRYIMDRKLNIPVIIFSAFGSLTEKEAFRLGVKGYFSKPFNYELLVSRISDVLKGNESIDLSENQLDGFKSKKASFYYAEDDDLDFEYLEKAFRENGLLDFVDLKRFEDGKSLLDDLGQGNVPDLLLIDVNIPLYDGYDILKWLKSSDQHHSIPKVMLTSLQGEKDMKECYELGASSFVVKPWQPKGWSSIAHSLKHAWLPQIALSK